MVLKGMLLFVPLALGLHYFFHAPPLWVFATAVLAIVPLADEMRKATEQVGHRLGPAIGGLLNVTFGNAAELILAIFVLLNGQYTVVKAQITGSIIGNGLLGLGLAILVGCWGRKNLTFNRERAGLLSSLLILSVLALLIPALFDYTERSHAGATIAAGLDERLSLGVSVVLILLYLANLFYTMYTHQEMFAFPEAEEEAPKWSLARSLLTLAGATALIAWNAELVSDSLEATAKQLGLTPFFLGAIVLAVIGNAAEYISAVYFARKEQMDMVMSITVGSSTQVALLVAPVLVLVSNLLGHPMNLVFSNPLELIAVAGVAFAVSSVARDGEATWFEGLLLLGVYILIGLAFFYVTPG